MNEEIAALEAIDLHQLREIWRAKFGPPPKLRSPELLRLNIAWRFQAARHGGLDAETRRRLRAAGGGEPVDRLQPGTKLIKEWQGRRHEVVVLEKGYRYAGKTHRSLSAIARSIAGSRWNGPRFFGLRTEERASA